MKMFNFLCYCFSPSYCSGKIVLVYSVLLLLAAAVAITLALI